MTPNRFNFRIWDKQKKKWLRDVLIDEHGRLYRVYSQGLDSFNLELVEDDYILIQSTGLTDCTGKEIFEGDVVEAVIPGNNRLERYIAEIIFRNSAFRLSLLHNRTINLVFGEKLISEEKLKIIGNIYENPELVGGKK